MDKIYLASGVIGVSKAIRDIVPTINPRKTIKILTKKDCFGVKILNIVNKTKKSISSITVTVKY